MASIRLESICCQFEENLTHPADHITLRTHYLIYNCLCVASSIVSILGSIYQIFPRGPPHAFRSPREAESFQRQNAIINWLAVADLLASIGILIRAAVWMAGYAPIKNGSGVEDGQHIFCAASSGWIQFFYVCTYFWTITYAVDVFRMVHEKPGCGPFYHIFGWVIPGLLCLMGLLPYYTPKLTQCGTELQYALPHYLVTYIPIVVVMIGNPIIYYFTQREVHATLRSRGLYTNQERQILKNIQTRFSLVLLVFYICWTPNIIDGIMIIFQSRVASPFMLGLWHFMALVNPLQAFLNSLVYRGVGSCWCCRTQDSASGRAVIQVAPAHLEESTEVSPLLSFRKSGHHTSTST